jgi:adenine phosphoribosyltransferase
MTHPISEEIRTLIRDVPDFPKPGIVFKDITTLLNNGPALRRLIDHLAARYRDAEIEQIVGIESRGFIFGTALAYALEIGFTLVRKPGKLPYKTKRLDYDLEYGTDAVEIHIDALELGQRVVIVDDLLATGGTAKATIDLVRSVGGVIHECAFVIELGFLPGRERLGDVETYSLVTYG